MTKVPQEGAAVLAQLLAIDLTIGVVRFFEIHGDHSIQVTGRHRGIGDRAHDVEGEAGLRVLNLGWEADSQARERVKETPLRHLHASP